MDINLVNEAFLHGYEVEITQEGELIGSGKIVKHTREDIVLDNGIQYLKVNCEISIK